MRITTRRGMVAAFVVGGIYAVVVALLAAWVADRVGGDLAGSVNMLTAVMAGIMAAVTVEGISFLGRVFFLEPPQQPPPPALPVVVNDRAELRRLTWAVVGLTLATLTIGRRRE